MSSGLIRSGRLRDQGVGFAITGYIFGWVVGRGLWKSLGEDLGVFEVSRLGVQGWQFDVWIKETEFGIWDFRFRV